jgi:dTDP-4-amino-4,6-dideoxygalactose transaminase
MSLMTEKSLPIGEGGILVTNNTEIYERAIAWGHYERFGYEGQLKTRYLQAWAGLPLGGHKYRMHQMSSAVGLVQLKHYDRRCAEIRKAFNYFWDLLDGVPGVRAHRVNERTGSNMAGWYAPHGLYVPEELGGLSVTRFCQAVQAEGAPNIRAGMNMPLHLHPIFNTADIYGDGKPTRIAFSSRDLRQKPGSLPVTEAANARAFAIPSFKRYYPTVIREYADAVRKVVARHEELLAGDTGNPKALGGWFFARHR